MTIVKTLRLGVFGALAVATIASAPLASADGQCLAWFGSRGEGQCMGYSNGTPTYIGTPNLGVWGPGYGGVGIVTGPLMPGTTINQGISP